MSSYGYMSMYKPIARRNTSGAGSLARAAASQRDPYGLAPNNRSGPLGIGGGTGFAAPAKKSAAPAVGGASPDARGGSAETNPNQSAAGSHPLIPTPTPTAAQVNHYDLNTDPALQQIQALAGLSNEQAQAAALKQRQDQLLAYGDQSIAESILGAGDPIALAAGKNPTSTVAQLGQSRDRNLKSLTEALNQQNLGYSGYRVTQEQQAGQDYNNALAQAAAGLNSNLGTIDSNLTGQLSANQQQVAQAINDAANRAAQQALTSGVDPGAIDPSTDPNALATAAAGGGSGEASGGAAGIGGTTAPAVGMTTNDLLYQLLGRKTDPRYQI